MLLLQRLLLDLFSLAVFFPAWSQGAYGFEPVNHSQSSIQQQGQGPTKDAVSRAVHSLTGARIVHSLSSSQPRIPPRSSSGVGEERVDFLKDENFLTDIFYEYEQGQAEIRVKDILRKNVGFGRKIGANQFVLDTITNGYVTPFYSTANSAICRDNNSALRNKLFVQ